VVVGPGGFNEKRREWNAVGLLLHWRKAWEDAANVALADAGSSARIDHRMLKAQGGHRPAVPSAARAE
jgi:hypothetical protein